MKSVFFCSEEHAHKHRPTISDQRGIYMTLDDAADLTRQLQSALFDFPSRSRL